MKAGWGPFLAGAALALAAHDASAQEGGQRLTGVLSQTFTVDSNFALTDPSEGTSYRSTTTLGIGYLTETRTERFSLDSDISLRGLRDGDGSTSLDASLPSVELGYMRAASRARLELGARYRQVPVTFLRGLEVEFDDEGGIIVPDVEDFIGGGDRATWGGDAALTFGVDTPLELTVRAGVDVTDYSGVTDPDLTDTETYTLGAEARLKVSPVVDATLALTGSRRSEDDAAQTETDTLILRGGIDYTVNERLSYAFGAQIGREEETTTGGSTSGTIYGIDAGMSYERPTSRFSGTIGLETTADEDTALTAALSFGVDLPQGAAFTGGLDRSLTFGTGGSDVVVTGARVAYVRPINSVSSASLGLSYSLSETLGGGGDPDETRVTLSAGYARAITENLDLSLGYAYRLRDEGALNADSHSVSLGLSMPFSF